MEKYRPMRILVAKASSNARWSAPAAAMNVLKVDFNASDETAFNFETEETAVPVESATLFDKLDEFEFA